jgi:hypothetical protein
MLLSTRTGCSACHMLSRWYLARLIHRPWRWSRYVPPKRRLIFNGLHGVMPQKIVLHRWTLNCTALTRLTEHGRSSHIASERTHREHRLHHLFYFCVTSPRTRMLRALHSNDCTRHVSWHLLHCCVRPLPSNGWCLQRHFLAMGLYATIYIYLCGFRIGVRAPVIWPVRALSHLSQALIINIGSWESKIHWVNCPQTARFITYVRDVKHSGLDRDTGALLTEVSHGFLSLHANDGRAP